MVGNCPAATAGCFIPKGGNDLVPLRAILWQGKGRSSCAQALGSQNLQEDSLLFAAIWRQGALGISTFPPWTRDVDPCYFF